MRDEHPRERAPGRLLLPACLALLLLGVATGAPATTTTTEAIQAQAEIPEDSLLDVGIQIFDPGLPPGDDYALEQNGIFEDIRKSESRYIPVCLMDTLQKTGNWGAVRVVPRGLDSVDLAMSGRIIESSGRKLVLAVRATDATGRRWLDEEYKQVADPAVYHEDALDQEPFQDLFNRIANDLLAARDKLDADERRRVRSIAELKFAADLAPVAFADYLEVDRKGLTVAARLPSADDPVASRVAQIRERDYMFVDTLTEYYVNFQARMSEPYDNWRKFSFEEETLQRKTRRSARTQKILGALGILGGVLIDGNGDGARAARQAGVVGGVIAIQSGMAKSQEVKMHVEALRELASSFDSEVAPLLVDVEGQTLRLSGSVETQYVTWRRLMREFFVTETGLPVDPDTGDPLVETTPEE